MIDFKQFQILCEMAAPTPEIQNMVFYHGTPSKEYADEIVKHGIKVSERKDKKSLTPVFGANYITPHLHYAQIYAIGGAMAGSDASRDIPKYGEHGYIFKISGKSLKDIQPDEDSIGEMIGNGNGLSWLHDMARRHISPSTLAKAKDGEYAKYAVIGKSLVKKMTDSQKIDLITNHHAHVANFSVLHPEEMYSIHRKDVKLLKRDGSNFFDFAQKHTLTK